MRFAVTGQVTPVFSCDNPAGSDIFEVLLRQVENPPTGE